LFQIPLFFFLKTTADKLDLVFVWFISYSFLSKQISTSQTNREVLDLISFVAGQTGEKRDAQEFFPSGW
jgi:cell division protein FtsL